MANYRLHRKENTFQLPRHNVEINPWLCLNLNRNFSLLLKILAKSSTYSASWDVKRNSRGLLWWDLSLVKAGVFWTCLSVKTRRTSPSTHTHTHAGSSVYKCVEAARSPLKPESVGHRKDARITNWIWKLHFGAKHQHADRIPDTGAGMSARCATATSSTSGSDGSWSSSNLPGTTGVQFHPLSTPQAHHTHGELCSLHVCKLGNIFNHGVSFIMTLSTPVKLYIGPQISKGLTNPSLTSQIQMETGLTKNSALCAVTHQSVSFATPKLFPLFFRATVST